MADTLRDLLYGAALRGQMPAAPMPLPDTIQRLAMQQGGSVGTPYRGTLAEMMGRGGTMAQRLAQALDQYGARIPGTERRITLKDLTLGDAGQVLENTSYGMPPTTGGNYATGGLGTIGASPQAMELFNLGGVAGGAVQTGKIGAKVLGPTLKEMVREGGEKYMRGIGAQQDLITWHGSPHTFDRFDSSKIGTGEGAQAYGHGLYLAESPEVAAQYQKNVTALRMPTDTFADEEVAAAKKLLVVFGPKDGAQQVKRMFGSRADEVLAKANDVTASLYKVDLPDSMIERMLDWDKPLSAQPFMNQQRLYNQMTDSGFDKSMVNHILNTKTGQELINELGGRLSVRNPSPVSGSVQASNLVKKAGIPGIRYLDGGSRADGLGTSNFVVFPGEESALTILERNGRPLR